MSLISLLSLPVILIATSYLSLAAERVALVIGNNAYQHGAPLKNCVNDAKAVAAGLRECGFAVILVEDGGLKELQDKLREFKRAATGAQAAWFFYAGHGAELAGTNYLIPVNAKVEDEYEVPHKTLALDMVLGAMDASGAPLKVLVLDCCRDNPFGRGWQRTNAAGLAQVGATPVGTIIAYATAPGKVAADGAGKNSPYTTALVSALAKPGLEIDAVFRETGRAVQESTNQRQNPWLNISFYGNFVVRQTNAIPESTIPAPPVPAPQIPPNTSEPTPNLPGRGYFGLEELYANGPYVGFNAYTRTDILRRAQQKLKDAGHYTSSVDGDPGPGTQRAIIAWQRSNGVTVTGKLDDATLRGMGLGGIQQMNPPVPSSRPKPTPPRPTRDNFFRDE